MYPIKNDQFGNCCPRIEIESGIAWRVAIHAISGNAIPKTMSTTTAPATSKLLLPQKDGESAHNKEASRQSELNFARKSASW